MKRRFIETEKREKKTGLSIREDIKIDERRLKETWEMQPQLVMEYASLASKKKLKKDLISRRQNIRWAELNKDIRKNPEKYFKKGEKITEGAITATIELDKEYCDLSRRFIIADYNYQIVSSVVNALIDKKKSLEKIQELILMKFYAVPSEKTEMEMRNRLNRYK